MTLGDSAILLAGLLSLALLITIVLAFVFAWLIGWRALAARYPASRTSRASEPVPGLVLGEWGWNAPPVRAALDDAGLLLVAVWPFGSAFRPVRIPWCEVTHVTRRRYMFFDVVELRYGPAAHAKLGFVPSPVVDEIEARVARRAP